MEYHFWDYKKFIEGYSGQDLFGTTHIVFMSCAFAFLIVCCILLRKLDKKYIDRFLKICSIILPISEYGKVIWESYWDITVGNGFNYAGLLPLYTCSLYMYILPFAAFNKGKLREYALAYMTTIGIFSGFANFVQLDILKTYPFWTYGTLSSVFYHFMLVFIGIFILVSGYYRPKAKDMLKAMAVLWFFSLFIIPINFIIYPHNNWVDYMQYMRGAGLPVLSDIAEYFKSINFHLGFSLFMATVVYGAVTAFTFGVYKAVSALCSLAHKKVSAN